MKHSMLAFTSPFEVALTGDRAQAAVMTLLPGEATGGDDNVHKGRDQWLFVVSGSGEAVVAGEPHEIRNTGQAPLETLNFYTPPEYQQGRRVSATLAGPSISASMRN